MILSGVSWKLAYRFSDPHLIEGGAVVAILGGTIWLIVLITLWFYSRMI